jgi:homoserine kinase
MASSSSARSPVVAAENRLVAVRVPATTANMGPGFDSFGLALSLYNRFHVEVGPGIQADALIWSPDNRLPCPEELTAAPAGENLFFQMLDRLFAEAGCPRPAARISLEVHIPFARGLGSSATAIIGALLAGNLLLESPLPQDVLIRLAVEAEGHPDNVVPALLGNVQLCDDLRAYRLPWPADWAMLVIIPPYKVSTEAARKVLPASVPLSDAVTNLRKASLLTYALMNADAEAFQHSLLDTLHQPARSGLIPDWAALSQMAQDTGALGFVISGSGPTMISFFQNAARLEEMEKQLAQYRDQRLAGLHWIRVAPDRIGAVAETL